MLKIMNCNMNNCLDVKRVIPVQIPRDTYAL
jgi:hypothetical protein